MRARLALLANGQRCVLREILLREKAPELLQASPKGTVPVLVLPDGTVIEESLDIMRWALAGNDPARLLDPPTGSFSDMLELIARSDGDFKRDLDAYKYAPRDAPEMGLAARGRGAAFLTGLDDRLAATGPYLLGDRPSLADLAIFPFVRQFANVDRTWFDGQPWPALGDWLAGWLASAQFERVMKKYARWRPGDAASLFP